MSDIPVHDHVTAEGGEWHSGPAAPIEPPANKPAKPGLTLLPGDILAIRAITRVDPPFDESWAVVTFQIHDRFGDNPGEYTEMLIGGRVLRVESPPEVATTPVAPPPAQPDEPAHKRTKGDAP